MNSYTFEASMSVGKRASRDVTKFLKSQGFDVKDVENYKKYQVKDIDLLVGKGSDSYTVEVKGDRYYQTGNYFLETVSNTGKGTQGCILYSEAVFLFYYFVEEKELHIVNMFLLQEWFKKNKDRFSTRTVNTGGLYNTEGKLVPREVVMEEVGVTIRKL